MSTSSLDRFDRPARFGGVLTFGLLFALESFVRSLNSTVVSLQTYDLLGTSQRVSMLMTGVSVVVLATGLSVPLLLARIPRRWGYTLGVLCLIAGSAALMANVVASQAFGIYFRNIGASLLNVTLALYILDHVRRFDLARVESARLSLSTLSWTAGPPLGVMLYTNYGAAAPQLVALAAAAALLALFWYLRLNDHGILRPARSSPPDHSPISAASWRNRASGSPGSSPSDAPASGSPSSSTVRCCWWKRVRRGGPRAGWSRRASFCSARPIYSAASRGASASAR